MNQRTLLFSLAAVAFMVVMTVTPALAEDAATAGNSALDGISQVFTGNIGLLLGLGLTVAGLWAWIIGQKTGVGITMIIGGVAFTMVPSLFEGARKLVSAPIAAITGDTDVLNVDTTRGTIQ